jgi:HemK-related putative methylase
MNPKNTTNRLSLLYRLYLYIIGKVRSNRLIHVFLFKYKPLKNVYSHVGYWDWTTLILRNALRKHLNPDDYLLDMGTGYIGVLAIYSNIYLNCKKVLAVDQLPQIITSAKKNAEYLNIEMAFCCSNLFENLNERFDCIVFNAPYIDTEGKKRGVLKDELSELRFSGGVGGGETIFRFLKEAPRYMTAKGKLLLGVSHHHISRTVILELISLSGFELCQRIENQFIPATAYILQKKKNKTNKL